MVLLIMLNQGNPKLWIKLRRPDISPHWTDNKLHNIQFSWDQIFFLLFSPHQLLPFVFILREAVVSAFHYEWKHKQEGKLVWKFLKQICCLLKENVITFFILKWLFRQQDPLINVTFKWETSWKYDCDSTGLDVHFNMTDYKMLQHSVSRGL